ncbi:MAG TPA: hypothetical protein VJB60_00945 [Candidatus Peribacterales bacterium]|nr:hypothetical protein [Candidatus Peribacterales bacterium]
MNPSLGKPLLQFASPGTPASTPASAGTLKGLERCKELGISAMELEWVQMVPKNVEHIEAIGQKAKNLGIVLTIHAPYYVNLNAKDRAILAASKKRILDFSGIAYGEKGEKHHLTLRESDAKWKEFLTVLKKRKIGGVLVVESPVQEEDVLLLQKAFAKLKS